MKHCPYCGGEHPENVTECPVGRNASDGEQTVIFYKKGNRHARYDIPPLPIEKTHNDWVTILAPHDEREADVVMGRLKASGIEVGRDNSQSGKSIQVRPKDYDAAKELLNAD